jgi:serine protease Do
MHAQGFSRSVWMRALLAAGALLLTAVQAAVPSQPSVQAAIDALTRANAAVVGVEVTAVQGARSARTLGQERSGSGVVIGPDGLVLTIGYLIVEKAAGPGWA